MPAEIYLVKVGMTMHEGTVEEWYVADGDRVEAGALLYRLETEKVNLDVDAETSGIVRHLVAEGTTLAPGDVVGYVYADGEAIPDVLPSPKSKPDIAARDDEPAAAANEVPETRGRGARAGGGKRIPASPVARKLASELGIDLALVTGTGPRGRITKEDVQKAADETAAPIAATPPIQTESADTVPLRGMRKTIAERMHASLRDTAQLTMEMEVGMSDAIKLRQALVDEWQDEGIRAGYTDLVIVAAARAPHPSPGHERRHGRRRHPPLRACPRRDGGRAGRGADRAGDPGCSDQAAEADRDGIRPTRPPGQGRAARHRRRGRRGRSR